MNTTEKTMKLKIVYDVISTEEDNYFEQAWVSMFRLSIIIRMLILYC